MNEATELKVLASLVDGDKEVGNVEKTFGLVPEHEDTEGDSEVKSIDTIIGEFMQEVQAAAGERGYTADNLALTEASFRVILFLVKHTQPEMAVTVPVEKPKPKEEKQDGQQTDT